MNSGIYNMDCMELMNVMENKSKMIGKTYRHRLSGEYMKVVKLNGDVATCLLEKPHTLKVMSGEMKVEHVVCEVKNLEETKLSLF